MFTNFLTILCYFLAKSTQTIVKPFKADASGQTKVNIHVPHSIGDSDNRSTLIHVPGTSSRKSVTFTNEQSANYDKVSKVVLNPKHVVSVITVENKPRDTGIEGKPKLNMDMSNEQTNGKQLYGRKRKLSDTYKRRTSTIDNGKVQNENNDEEEVSRTINQPNKGAPNAAIKQADSRNTRDLRERPKSLTSLLVFKTPTIISTGSSISLGQYKCDSSS